MRKAKKPVLKHSEYCTFCASRNNIFGEKKGADDDRASGQASTKRTRKPPGKTRTPRDVAKAENTGYTNGSAKRTGLHRLPTRSA
jgi:hypothetical protein